MAILKTTKQFIKEAILVHGNMFNYNEVVYLGNKKNVLIRCRKHGLFNQQPAVHLRGFGCRHCQYESIRETMKLTQSEFLEKAVRVHGYKYEYKKYQGMYTPIEIKCKVHGWFFQVPKDHIDKSAGCKKCNGYSFKYDEPAILYYISIDNGCAYKIGVTNNTVEVRYSSSELTRIKIIKTWDYATGRDAFDEEQRILKSFNYAKLNNIKLLNTGNTELFQYDVLNLDTQ